MSATATASNAFASAGTQSTDRVERQVRINASRAQVWRALANAEEFGNWFGANLKGQAFVTGQKVRGQMTSCGHEHVVFDAVIERLEPEKLMAFRWHPYAVDPAADYSGEERTLVVFELHEAQGGTLLTVVESGFDKVPPARRAEAFKMHGQGWTAQLDNIARHVTSA